ncbi:F-box only protein 25-like [Tubulanus polymorphus]|uniref:F-box only protein 25-like n=1 Tax=Tubulanus polymorphus TaxID=672921 RepID=UPI003DA29ADA
MPYIGQDWRCPGLKWIKSRTGTWKLACYIEPNEASSNDVPNEDRIIRFHTTYDDCMEKKSPQPHVHISRGSTRERVCLVSLSDALSRLDFYSAVKDIRRFKYACKVVEIILTKHYSDLSGTCQRQIFSILEEVLQQVIHSQNNLHTMHQLLNDLNFALVQSETNHIGSQMLWDKHKQLAESMEHRFNTIKLKEREDEGITLTDLPTELVRSIIHRLTDHVDILNTGSTRTSLYMLTEEQILWRNLCYFHFDDNQLICHGLNRGEYLDDCNWKYAYKKLAKKYGSREIYAVMLHQCCHCNIVFWASHGHPCPLQPDENYKGPSSTPISPDVFIKLFFK